MDNKVTRLVFGMRMSDTRPGYSKSKIEFVPDKDRERWKHLAEIPNWRHVMSSLFVQPMVLCGKTFRTVEHYLQYCKVAIVDEKVAASMFALESGSSVACGDGFAARKARKTIMLNDAQWKLWKGGLEKQAKETARIAKFSKGTVAHRVLLATQDAELWSVVPRCESIRMFHHEKLREELRTRH